MAWRLAYYAFAFGCWWVMRRRPAWTPVVGIAESSVNLLLLILSVLGPLFAAPAVVAEDGLPELAFGPGRLVNFALSGTVLVLAFRRHQAALRRSLGQD